MRCVKTSKASSKKGGGGGVIKLTATYRSKTDTRIKKRRLRPSRASGGGGAGDNKRAKKRAGWWRRSREDLRSEERGHLKWDRKWMLEALHRWVGESLNQMRIALSCIRQDCIGGMRADAVWTLSVCRRPRSAFGRCDVTGHFISVCLHVCWQLRDEATLGRARPDCWWRVWHGQGAGPGGLSRSASRTEAGHFRSLILRI